MMPTALISRLVASTRYEDDEEFRKLVSSTVSRRIVTIGVLCLGALACFLVIEILVRGKAPIWSYDEITSEARVGLADKLTVAVVSLLLVATRFLRMPLSSGAGRVVVATAAVAVVAAMTLDDVASGTVTYSQDYVALVILVVVGVVPFPPIQALLTAGAVFVSWYFSIVWCPPIFGLEAASVGFTQIVFLTVVWVSAGGIAATLYASRYREFQVQREIRAAEKNLREHAEDLERSTEQLHKLRQLRSRFFAGISHEFRTPITLILGPATDALRRGEDRLTEDVVEALHLIRRSGSRLENLVDQLLDLSRLDEGRLPLSVGRYDAVQFCRMTFALFESLAKTHKITFSFEADCPSCHAYFDAEQMQKVLTNLLSNAFKFTPDGGMIRLRISKCPEARSDCIDISVKDNGKGIPLKDLPLVFDRFYQVRQGSMQPLPGSGIGLALAKELVDIHGGELLVTSGEGLGSEFTIRLLAGSEHFDQSDLIEESSSPFHFKGDAWATFHDSNQGVPGSSSTNIPGNQPTVLAVDDHDDMRRYMYSLLKQRYQVVLASHGAEGLEMARKIKPDLIISDMMMPELDGLSFCSAIKNDEVTAHIPFILLTALESHDDRLEGFGAGADDYVVKPFDAEELMARAENLIEIRRALQKMTRDGANLIEPSAIEEPSADEIFLNSVRESAENHLGDTNFTVDLLADDVGLSRRQLERRLRQTLEFTPAGYIRLMRLKRGAQLLERKVGTVSEIAYKVGFKDPNYFSRLFIQTFGIRPSEYADREN